MKITILIDNPRSWFVPFGEELAKALKERGHEVMSITDPKAIPEGDCVFFLSCEQIIGKELRARNKYNLVIHASALPQGKGWSPLAWQVLEGKNEIPLTMFEAVDKVDAGDVYGQARIGFQGHELIDEMRQKEGGAIVALALQFVDGYSAVVGRPQEGEETFYPRRTPKDSELDPNKSLVASFNQLRIADNDRYPAFFKHLGHTYILKISKKDET